MQFIYMMIHFRIFKRSLIALKITFEFYARPKIAPKLHFELVSQFLAELPSWRLNADLYLRFWRLGLLKVGTVDGSEM